MAHLIRILLFFAVIPWGGLTGRQAAPTEPGTPGAVVVACAEAFSRHDFKAAAGMVVGGDTAFDYRRMVANVPEFGRKKVRFLVTKVQVDGDAATVDFGSEYDGVTYGEQKIGLKRMEGVWKLAPNGTGYEFERLVLCFVIPEKLVRPMEEGHAMTRNLDGEAIRLGKARTVFLSKVFSVSEGRYSGDRPYSGYEETMMDQGTEILFPAGRADELIFCLVNVGQSEGGKLTYWKLVRGKPRRIWQVNVTGKGVRVPKVGSLAKLLDTPNLPKNSPSDLVRLMGVSQGYACYTLSVAMGCYYCGFFNGEARKNWGRHGEPPQQDDWQAGKAGFYITPEEIFYLRSSELSR